MGFVITLFPRVLPCLHNTRDILFEEGEALERVDEP